MWPPQGKPCGGLDLPTSLEPENLTPSGKELRRSRYEQRKANAQRADERPYKKGSDKASTRRASTVRARAVSLNLITEETKFSRKEFRRADKLMRQARYEQQGKEHAHMKTEEKVRAMQGSLVKTRTLSTQSGTEFIEGVDKILKSLASLAGEHITDDIIKEFEGLALLFTSLQGARDAKTAISLALLYIRNFFSKSLTSSVCEYSGILAYFNEPFGAQSGEEDERDSWSSMMKNIYSDWGSVKESRFFKVLSKALGLIVTLELCKISDVTFSIGKYKLLAPELSLVHANAWDIFDAALSTVVFFVEKISLCWKEKSLTPLFRDLNEFEDMDEEYSTLVSYWDLVKNGNLERIHSVTDNEFALRLEKMATQLKCLIPSLSGLKQRLLQDRLERMTRIQNDLVTMKISTQVRKAPYVMEFFGSSNQGKTTVSEQIVTALLCSAGLPTSKDYQGIVNASEKYMSSWRSNKLVLTIDDFANDKSNMIETSPTRLIIDIVNNTPYIANMADIDRKGRTYVEPRLVVVTTNKKDLDASSYSNCPYSIQRRMNVIITVQAKEEFQMYDSNGDPMGLDSKKVAQAYHNKPKPVLDDLWELTLERATQPETLEEIADYETIWHNDQPLEKVGMRPVLNYLIEEFHKHQEAQDGILERARDRIADIKLCGVDGCNQIAGYCDVHDDCHGDGFPPQEGVPYTSDVFPPQEEEYHGPTPEQALEEFANAPVPKINLDPKPSQSPPAGEEGKVNGRPRFKQAKVKKLSLSRKQKKAYFRSEERHRGRGFHGTNVNHKYRIEPENVVREEDIPKTPVVTTDEAVKWAQKWQLKKGNAAFQPHASFWQTKPEVKWERKVIDTLGKATDIVSTRVKNDFAGVDLTAHNVFSTLLIASATRFAKRWSWLNVVPTSWIEKTWFVKLLAAHNSKRIKARYALYTMVNWSITGFGTHYANKSAWLNKSSSIAVSGVMLSTSLMVQKGMANLVLRQYQNELRKRNVIAPIMKDLRDSHVANVVKAGGALAVFYGIAKVYREWSKTNSPQGNLRPTAMEHVVERDAEYNPWSQCIFRPLPVQPVAANTTSAQLHDLVKRNLYYGSVKTKDGRSAVNGLFLRSNIVVIPQHYFIESPCIEIEYQKCHPGSAGGRFRTVLSTETAYFVPNSDMAICYSPTGGSFRDLTRYLPDGVMGAVEFTMYYRKKNGDLIDAKGYASPEETTNGFTDFHGLRYRSLTMNTFEGLCGATLVSNYRAMIAGFHVGGIADTPEGCASIITLSDMNAAVEKLRTLNGVILSANATAFNPVVMGKNVMTGDTPHGKSPMRYLPEGSQLQFHGTCLGQSTFKSNAKKTLITDIVEEVMEAPNIYMPPEVNPQWKPYQAALAQMSKPGEPIDPALLNKAVSDYKGKLVELIRGPLWNDARPLLDHENWNGRPGIKFVDRINLNTAIGFPHTGKKSKFVTEVEPMEGYSKQVEPNDMIQIEIDRLMECYRRGERGYPIAKAVKKDEIHAKPKCRIFYSNPTSITFLIRRYFLPLLRFLQFNPLDAECAVGINSHGPEWEELHQHIFKFGKDRLFAGDYGKYDQKIPSQMLFAAFKILIDLARECNYSKEDLDIMEAMTGDIVFAIIAFNGDLIGLVEGGHISGNSLTVILNGIVGALNLRSFWYTLYTESFRENMSLTTYGDDNAGTVRPGFNKFTIKNFSEWLGDRGQIYTMPDKESELLDYLPPEQFEFLKRSSVYHPKLGCRIGALCDKSIYKMLHYYLRDSKAVMSEEMACAQNIDTALTEWFNHGESKFELRRSQLQAVAEKAGLVHLCSGLELGYTERAELWLDKYAGTFKRCEE